MLEKIDIEEIKNIAKLAGDKALELYVKPHKIHYKNDLSPLTEADTICNRFICDALQSSFPNIPIMSEENKNIDYLNRKDWKYYWCIDPIDGTKEFINKNDEFTINIGLVYKCQPVLGVVYAPALNDMYFAKAGNGAYKNTHKLPLVNKRTLNDTIVVVSKSHFSVETQNFIKCMPETQATTIITKGSSLKLCMVAEGAADIYPRLEPTMEWDTVAADAIVREAGKMSYDIKTGLPLTYNKESLVNPGFVVKK